MRIVYFTHSLVSCWNHGNAHFIRGVLRALIARGHEMVAFEPSNGWSRANLVAVHGEEVTGAFERAFPDLAGCV
jgi:spore maturation protein CgeB